MKITIEDVNAAYTLMQEANTTENSELGSVLDSVELTLQSFDKSPKGKEIIDLLDGSPYAGRMFYGVLGFVIRDRMDGKEAE